MKVSDERTIQHLDTDELIFHLIKKDAQFWLNNLNKLVEGTKRWKRFNLQYSLQ